MNEKRKGLQKVKMPKSKEWSIKKHDYTRIDEIEQKCREVTQDHKQVQSDFAIIYQIGSDSHRINMINYKGDRMAGKSTMFDNVGYSVNLKSSFVDWHFRQ